MKNTTIFLSIVLVILPAACQSNAPEALAVPEPTVAAETIEEASPEALEETDVEAPTVAPTDTPVEATAPHSTEANAAAEPATEEEPVAETAEAGASITEIADEQLQMMAAIAPPPQLSDREPGIHTVPCFPGKSPGANEVEGEDYTCGVFTAPQNWDEPDSRHIDLAFMVARATGENPGSDPLIFLAGGPGASGVLSMGIERYQELRPDHDIIFFDIRGAGLSQRLGNEECLVLALQNGAPAEQIEALRTAAPNLLTAASGEPISGVPPFSELDFLVLNEICWEQFTAQGLDLNQFSTATNARDVVELIKALGYESFNIHSASYGTRLTMTIMDTIPGYDDAPELRSVVLDSTFPPSAYLVRTLVRSDHDFILQLLEECQADTACNEAFPNLKGRLAALLNRLEQEPLIVNGETVTIDDVVNELTNVGSTRAGYLPKMIVELESGVLDTYLALRDGAVGTDLPEALPSLVLDPSDPVQAFIADSSDLIGGDEALEFKVYVDFALVQEDPLAMLQAIIADGDAGEIGNQLLEMLGTLTAEDIANSPYVAQLPKVELPEEGEGDPEEQLARTRWAIAGRIPTYLYSSIHCADDILHERFEDAVNSYNDLQFPQVTDLVESQAMAARCENWPIAAAPVEVKDPVSSDVRALILQGAYDEPTPIYMGRRAARELENSTYVLIPQQGHGTWNTAGGCVGQIATAFVQDPEAALDLSCLDARRPSWALPDAPVKGEGDSGQPVSSTVSHLTTEQMKNAAYSGFYEAPVTLVEGVYEGEPFAEGGAARPVVTYADNTLVHGDLDGDGMDDAVALLIENSGGSGVFSYVGAQLNRSDQPIDAGAALLGDRVQLISMDTSDGQVTAEIVTQGPDEGLCCGTLKMRKTLELQDGQLVEIASEELDTVSLDDLMGTQWNLLRLNFDQEPLVDVTISADFADGMVSGAGGCNNYSADVTSDGGQLLAVAPIATTRMACDDELEALEAEYLAALQSATEWRFYPGQLAISYVTAGGEQGTLFFDPATIK